MNMWLASGRAPLRARAGSRVQTTHCWSAIAGAGSRVQTTHSVAHAHERGHACTALYSHSESRRMGPERSATIGAAFRCARDTETDLITTSRAAAHMRFHL